MRYGGIYEDWFLLVEISSVLLGGDLGIALLPRFAVERQLADGTLQAVESDFPWESITAVCSHHKNKWVTPAMELFMELTREHFAALRQPEGQQAKYA